MVSRSRLSQSTPVLVGALLLLAGFFVGACDLVTGSSQDLGSESESSVPANATLAHSPMPKRTSLPSPEEVPLKNGTVQAYRESQKSPEGIPQKSDSSSTVESPYGCYLASRPYTNAVRFRSVYLYFPESMVEAAENETKRVILSVQAASAVDSAAVADNLGEAMERREKTGVRYATCVLPAAAGAESLANEQLLRAGEKKAALNAVETAGKGLAKDQVCFIQEVTTCAGWSSNQSCGTDHEYVCGSATPGSGSDDGGGGYPDPGDGTGGGGGGDGGDGGGEGDGDPTDCSNFPRPGDWCEPKDPDVEEDRVCTSDPLADMDIRSTCDGVEGGRYGYTRGPNNTQFHGGLDLSAEVGTELFAMKGGEVAFVGNDPDGWGNYVVIQSATNGSRFALYAHLSSVSVQEDQSVNMGTQIGETGMSGNAGEAECNPAHLHLEVREGSSSDFGWTEDNGGETKDPENYVGTEFDDSGNAKSDDCSPVFKSV